MQSLQAWDQGIQTPALPPNLLCWGPELCSGACAVFAEVWCHTGKVLFGWAWSRRPSALLTLVGREGTRMQRQVCRQYLLEAALLLLCFMSVIPLS